MASSGVTSNAAHTCCSMICSSGVRPSAASQMAEAASLRLNRVESRGDMIMVSSPNIRVGYATLLTPNDRFDLSCRYDQTPECTRLEKIVPAICGMQLHTESSE